MSTDNSSRPSGSSDHLHTADRGRSPHAVWWCVTLLLVLALGLRLYRLGHANFWIDEVSSIEVAVQPLRDIVVNYQPGHHPWRGAEQAPLALVVMHFFLSPDLSEASARLPSALIGTLSLLALFLLTRRMLSTPVALLAALLLALSPLHVWYSQEARWYAQWLLLTILSYGALLAARDTGRRRYWLAYALVSALSVYTFVLSFLVVAAQGLSVLWLDLRRGTRARMLPRFIGAQLVVVLVCLPVVRMILATRHLTTGTPRPKGMAELPYTFFAYLAGYSAGPTTAYLHSMPSLRDILTAYPIVIVFATVFFPLVLLGLRRVRTLPTAAAVLLPWCFVPPVMAFAISLASNVTYQARYGSAALPALLVLVALGSLSVPQRLLRATAIAAVVLCFLTGLRNHYWNPDYAKEDVKGALAYVRAHGHDGAAIAVVGQVAPAAAYYEHDRPVVAIETCDVVAGRPDPLRQAGADHSAALWLLVGRDWDGAAERCLARLAPVYTWGADQHFAGGVELKLLVRQRPGDPS